MEEDPAGSGVGPKGFALPVFDALNQAGAKYLVIGGIACVLHGHLRTTSDVDILIERTSANARRVLEALGRLGWQFAREWSPKELLERPITVIGDDPAVDIFSVAWDVKYEDAVTRSSIVEAQGVRIPLASIEDVIASKRTGRLQDAADIEVLEEILRLRGAG